MVLILRKYFPLILLFFCLTQMNSQTGLGINTVVIDPGKLDRSPCGTGCSARMAVLHAKGDLKKGDRMIGRSILDSRFDCQIVEEVLIGNQIAIIPSIKGRAWITGTHQLDLDDEDPFPNGYRLSDTWPIK